MSGEAWICGPGDDSVAADIGSKGLAIAPRFLSAASEGRKIEDIQARGAQIPSHAACFAVSFFGQPSAQRRNGPIWPVGHAGNDRTWRNRSLQPKTAFSRFPPVHRADLEGRQRVDCAISQGRPARAAICAQRPLIIVRQMLAFREISLSEREPFPSRYSIAVIVLRTIRVRPVKSSDVRY